MILWIYLIEPYHFLQDYERPLFGTSLSQTRSSEEADRVLSQMLCLQVGVGELLQANGAGGVCTLVIFIFILFNNRYFNLHCMYRPLYTFIVFWNVINLLHCKGKCTGLSSATLTPWSLGHKSSIYTRCHSTVQAATAHWLISLTGTHLYTWRKRSKHGIFLFCFCWSGLYLNQGVTTGAPLPLCHTYD